MKKIKLYDYQQRVLEDIIHVLTTKEITRFRKKRVMKKETRSSCRCLRVRENLRDGIGGEMVP